MDTNPESFWTQRYEQGNTGWDVGEITTPLKTYIDQLPDRSISILIPGAGNAYEAEYLHRQGFTQVHVIDIARPPVKNLQQRIPGFPESHLHHGDFFEHEGSYALILEQTFFCALAPDPATRQTYADQMFRLLKPGGKLVGLWFKHPLTGEGDTRPFGGSKEEYLGYFEPKFHIRTFADCYNSISARMGNEYFAIMEKLLA